MEENIDNTCPVCGVPSHVKDIQTNRQLSTAASLCKQLDKLLIARKSPVKGGATLSLESNHLWYLSLSYLLYFISTGHQTNEDDFSKTESKTDHPTPAAIKAKDVFEFPEGSPEAVAGRTRKASKIAKKQKFLAKSNTDWRVGEDVAGSVCGSCQRGSKSKAVKFTEGQQPLEMPAMLAEDDGDAAESTTQNDDEVRGDGSMKDKCSKKRGKAKGRKLAKNSEENGTEPCGDENAEAKKTKKDSVPSSDIVVDETGSACAKRRVKAKRSKKHVRKSTEPTPESVPCDAADSNGQPWPSPESSTAMPLDQPKKAANKTRRKSYPPQSSKVTTPVNPASWVNTSLSASISSSPATAKRNAKGETPLQVAVIKVIISHSAAALSSSF